MEDHHYRLLTIGTLRNGVKLFWNYYKFYHNFLRQSSMQNVMLLQALYPRCFTINRTELSFDLSNSFSGTGCLSPSDFHSLRLRLSCLCCVLPACLSSPFVILLSNNLWTCSNHCILSAFTYWSISASVYNFLSSSFLRLSQKFFFNNFVPHKFSVLCSTHMFRTCRRNFRFTRLIIYF